MRAGHPAARRAGVLEVVVTDWDRPEGSTRKGCGRSDGNVNGVRVRGRARWGREMRRRWGVPGSEQVQWIGVERGGG